MENQTNDALSISLSLHGSVTHAGMLAAALLALSGAAPITVSAPVADNAGKATGSKKGATGKNVQAPQTQVVAPVSETEDTETKEDDAKTATMEDLRLLAGQLTQENKLDAARKVFQPLGYTKVAQIQPEHYQQVYEGFKALL